MLNRPTFRLRTAALTATAALALGAAACGGSSDDDAANDEQQARATVEALYAAMADYDAKGVCAQLNEAAQEQLAKGGLGKESGSCEESFQAFLDSSKKAGGLDLPLKAKIESIKVTGDTAVAKVTYGGKGLGGEIPLEKVDGEWKLEAAGAAPSQ